MTDPEVFSFTSFYIPVLDSEIFNIPVVSETDTCSFILMHVVISLMGMLNHGYVENPKIFALRAMLFSFMGMSKNPKIFAALRAASFLFMVCRNFGYLARAYVCIG